MTIIPILSALEINHIEDYTRFRNLKLYIQSKSKLVPHSKELSELSCYRNPNKFQSHRKEFDSCKRDIPLQYLEAIGVDVKTVTFCQELDKEEFERTKALQNLTPKHAIVRYMAAVYGSKSFPPNTSEAEAIEILRAFCQETKLLCAINYPSFKTIYISNAGETVLETYYPPEIQFTKEKLVLAEDGHGIGQTKIG